MYLIYPTVLLLGCALTHTADTEKESFPSDFLLGFATSSYQIEGGWNVDGKGENVWDNLTHSHPDLITNRDNGDIAADSYNKYKEDVALLKETGAQLYRFSVSWSRILPTGLKDIINPLGLNYYNSLIDELILNGIQPMVTIHHFDLPQPLADIGGWQNPELVDYFEDYARILFNNFGDRVKLWITFNEPFEQCIHSSSGLNGGEYFCAHRIIEAHARVFHLYDRNFRPSQQGKIGITLNGGWNEPLTSSPEDIEAAETQMQFQVGWFAHPILLGGYPEIMRHKVFISSKLEGKNVSALPAFDFESLNYVRGTADFLGINHYTTYRVSSNSSGKQFTSLWDRDSGNTVSQDPNWPGSGTEWLKVVPWGFRKQLNWVKNHYGNVPIFVTENGYADNGGLQDTERINYHTAYIREMLKAIYEDKCNVVGYVVWSLLDNFEWFYGYTVKFGVYHIDFDSPNRTRTAKASAEYFKNLFITRHLPIHGKSQ